MRVKDIKTVQLITLFTLIVFVVLSYFITFNPNRIGAATGGVACGHRTLLGLPAWDKYLDHEEIDGRCSPVIENTADALPIGIAVLEIMLRLGGLVAVAMVFVGAFKFIASQGSPDSATAARKTIINAMVGLVIIILSSAIVGFVGSRFV